jgi:transcriptional regulator with XRE-family HTH domain
MQRSRLPNYLRTHRKRACLSQKEVAFLIGSKSGARVCRYERNRQAPNLRTLLAYEILFRSPIQEVYGGVADEVELGLKRRVRLLIQKIAKLKPGRHAAQKLSFLSAVLGEAPPGGAP